MFVDLLHCVRRPGGEHLRSFQLGICSAIFGALGQLGSRPRSARVAAGFLPGPVLSAAGTEWTRAPLLRDDSGMPLDLTDLALESATRACRVMAWALGGPLQP